MNAGHKWDRAAILAEVSEYDFFFSSRRRHTKFDCDWSSDVCSSDLEVRGRRAERVHLARLFFDADRRHVADVRHDQLQEPPHGLLELERRPELAARIDRKSVV